MNEREEILNISQFSSNQIKKQFEDFCLENEYSRKYKTKNIKYFSKTIINYNYNMATKQELLKKVLGEIKSKVDEEIIVDFFQRWG